MAIRKVTLCLTVAVTLIACSLGSQAARQTPAPVATEQPKPQATLTLTDDLPATQAVKQTAEALAAALTLAAEQEQATSNARATSDAKVTQTAQAVSREATRNAPATRLALTKFTATARVQATSVAQEAQFRQEVLAQVYDDGIINTTDGEYIRLDDFDKSWAQIGWYQWYHTDLSPENFVLSTDVTWNTASTTSNWPETGCGFIFAEQDNNNHSLVYLGLDGFVYIGSSVNGNGKLLSAKRYGKLDIPAGQAGLTLVVHDKTVTVYVNGQKVASARDGRAGAGDLAYTVLSGTNKDFGTRCNFTNTHIIVLE